MIAVSGCGPQSTAVRYAECPRQLTVIARRNAPKQSSVKRRFWIASAVALRAMADTSLRSQSRHKSTFSRHDMPELCPFSFTLSNWRAQGRPGAGWRPWSACSKKARGRTTGAAEIARPSLRDGFNAYTRSPRGPALLPPSPTTLVKSIANLTSAPGRQDHATSPSTPDCAVARNRSRPSQPASTFVTTRTPLRRGGMRREKHSF
jgi:hypothetical protein